MEINVTWRKHQESMVAFALSRFSGKGGFAWWIAGCRTGKTLASLGVVQKLKVQRTLVLTTKTAVNSAWQQDIEDFVENIDYILFGKQTITTNGKVSGLSNVSKKARFMLKHALESTTPLIVVLNYESARIMAKSLDAMNFDLVILDESHKVKSHNSKQSKTLAKTFLKVPYKLLMTGTGWEDRPTDVYGQIRFMQARKRYSALDSVILGTWGTFFERYANYYLMDRVKIATGYKNLEELREVLAPFTLYVDSYKVLDLPTEYHETLLLVMPKPMRKVYTELDEHMVLELDGELLLPDNQLVKALRLHQITSGYVGLDPPKPLFPDTQNPKLQTLLTLLDEIGTKPTVIFTRFTFDVALISKALKAQGVSYKQLTGSVDEHKDWMDGQGQVLIANIAAGGTGISLNRARYCIYYSVGHSATDLEQSLWRIRAQPDPTQPIHYFHICIAHSVDTEIRETLDKKKKVSKLLLKGLTT